MALVVVRWVGEDGSVRTGGMDALAEVPADAKMWADVTDPDEATLQAFAAAMCLHALSVEDMLHAQVRPKMDLYPEGPFLAWLTPRVVESGDLEMVELDVALYASKLLTAHRGTVEAVDEVGAMAAELLPRGVDWVLHAILDRLVDSMLPIADAIGDSLEDIEDRMLATPVRSDLQALYLIRRRLLVMHRTVSPERDMVLSLARQQEQISEEVFRYFSDVVDHLLRIQESLETFRDIGSGVMDIYLSAQSNRLNEIMKVLTVVTVVLGALTAISGIYGMNLIRGMWPPEDAIWSFPAVIVAMIAVAGVMSYYFRRKNWW